MRVKLTLIVIALLLSTITTWAQGQADRGQTLYKSGSQQSFTGPEQFFTGSVHVQMLFPKNEHTAFAGAYVTFQPSARSAWHSHPAGQHIIVTDGVCLTGTRDGRVLRFQSGEAVWCPPGVDHWHGATPERAMTHLVITGVKNGQNVVWKEKVTDEQYHRVSNSPTR